MSLQTSHQCPISNCHMFITLCILLLLFVGKLCSMPFLHSVSLIYTLYSFWKKINIFPVSGICMYSYFLRFPFYKLYSLSTLKTQFCRFCHISRFTSGQLYYREYPTLQLIFSILRNL